jgi:hypothetical protein
MEFRCRRPGNAGDPAGRRRLAAAGLELPPQTGVYGLLKVGSNRNWHCVVLNQTLGLQTAAKLHRKHLFSNRLHSTPGKILVLPASRLDKPAAGRQDIYNCKYFRRQPGCAPERFSFEGRFDD